MKRYLISSICLSLLSHSLCAQDAAAFKAKRDAELKAKKIAVDKIMEKCGSYTASGDVNNRKISEEIMKGMDPKSCVPYPATIPSDSLNVFFKDIDKAVRSTDQNKIYDETTKIALKKSVKAFLSLHMRVVKEAGPLSPEKALRIVCGQVKGLCAANRPELALIKSQIGSFISSQAKKPIKYLDGGTEEVLKKEFNSYVDLANQTCALTHKKYREIEAQYSCLTFNAPKPGSKLPAGLAKPMSQGECQGRQEQRIRKNRELENIAKQSINLNMQLLISSDLGPLFATPSFRKKVGVMKPESIRKSCMENWKDKEHKVLSPVWHEDISTARTELYKLAADELKTIQKNRLTPPEYVDKEEELQKYLKTNPQTVAELLKRDGVDPQYAKSICSYIKGIYKQDRINNYIDAGLVGVGVASSIALGFATGGLGIAVLSPAGVALSAMTVGSTAVIIGKNAVGYHKLLREDQLSRQAMSTQQRNLDKGIAALDTNELKEEALLSNMKWSAAGAVLEVAGIGFAMSKASSYINNLKKTPVPFEMVEGSTTSAKATNLHKGSQAFTKAAKTLDPKAVGLLKDLSPDQQTKLAALFSKMSEVEAKAMVEKLSKLDAKQFAKFFSVVDELSLGNSSEKALLAALDDFSKTGKPSLPKLTPEQIAELGPSVPKGVRKIASVYPTSTNAIKEISPNASPEDIQKILLEVRNKFRGKIDDDSIGLLISRFADKGASTPAEILQEFEHLKSVKLKHADLFAPNGVMNKAGLKDESEITKLHFIDDIEKNGLPMRNAKGELIMSADGQSILRKKISNMTPAQKLEAITKELNTVATQSCAF